MPHTLTMREKRFRDGRIYYPLRLQNQEKPTPGEHELLVKMEAAALNHRDLFVRQNQYPRIAFEAPLLSDGCGVVIEAGSGCDASWLDQKVILTPSRGWKDSPEGPEDPDFSAIGGTEPFTTQGCAQTYVVVPEAEVEVLPKHMSSLEGAALPTCGLTAWRALCTKTGNAKDDRNILITGIGGGVALQALQFAVAKGCNVWVTSGSEEKLRKARDMGARDGVLYKQEGWHKKLLDKLPSERRFFDAIVDGAGGDIAVKGASLLKHGGVISCYGMTQGALMDWPMQAVLKNIELRGSTLGSRVDFADMVKFTAEKEIRPVVSRSVKGLASVESIEGLFNDIKGGKQFGKLVIEF